MLVLTRRSGEKLIIDGGIEITVLDISGRQAKIGIQAPKGVSIYREELYERMQQQAKEEKPIEAEAE
jgi:carbon storage regulator